MKSVHITNYYHKNSGGISTAYNKLLEAANRHRRYVRLIVPGEKTVQEEIGEFGRIYYVQANYSKVFDKRYRVMLPWKTYIFDQSPIKKILREEKPDIIEIGEKYLLSLMAGLLRKGVMNIAPSRPMLVHLSCERMDDNFRSYVSRNGPGDWICRRFLSHYLFPMFDFHLANSQYTAEELFGAVLSAENQKPSPGFLNFCWRLFRSAKTPINKRILISPCGVDNKTFSASRRSAKHRKQICEAYELPESAKLLLYAGRLSPEKNIKLLPELMRILSRDDQNDFRFLIAGTGPQADWLAKECEVQAKGKVTMLGHLNNIDELADLFANCDAFVHPNPREPFGITPLEAMASGLPVVAPNSGGLLSYASIENAWLVEPKAGLFAAAVSDIFKDESRRQAKISRALETCKQYTWESSTDALFLLYDKMLSDYSRDRHLYDYDDRPKDFDFVGELLTKA